MAADKKTKKNIVKIMATYNFDEEYDVYLATIETKKTKKAFIDLLEKTDCDMVNVLRSIDDYDENYYDETDEYDREAKRIYDMAQKRPELMLYIDGGHNLMALLDAINESCPIKYTIDFKATVEDISNMSAGADYTEIEMQY